MQEILEQIRDRVLRQSDKSCMATAIPRVSIAIAHGGGGPEIALCGAGICLVLQGTKTLVIGDQTLRQSAGISFASLVELPATRCLYESGNGAPYVATGLTIDRQALISLLADIVSPSAARRPGPCFSIEQDSRALLEAWDRHLTLFETPSDIPALAVSRERELLYRLLQSSHGPLLWQMVQDQGRITQVQRAIDWIRARFDQHLPVKELAEVADMSVAAFNRHFRAATSTSPLQYQKALRLQAARILLAKGNDATRAAYAVGYGSVPQFTREYARHFGRAPKRDACFIRENGISDEMV